jgi:aminoglycoside/choline kinase family phosphotransferase
MTQSTDPLLSLERWARRCAGHTGRFEVVPMPGGASLRRFFRVGLGGQSAVAIYVPDALQSEEVTQTGARAVRWPFLEVRDLLASRGIRVPRLVGEACADGWMVVEDLGDDTLASYLLRHPEQRERLYQRAVHDLARAQEVLSSLPEGCIVGVRAFDYSLLHWEIQHFREWALEARGLELAPEERAVFDRAAHELASIIAAWPRGFVHRDYQSRNLMVLERVEAEPELVWIDFQDALLGPRVYDLVALLNDSYQNFDGDFIERRLDEFAACFGWNAADRRALGLEFDLVTVQRKLKDAGRFVFIDRAKNNPSYLGFVEPTVAKVRASLARLVDYPALTALDALLARILGECR